MTRLGIFPKNLGGQHYREEAEWAPTLLPMQLQTAQCVECDIQKTFIPLKSNISTSRLRRSRLFSLVLEPVNVTVTTVLLFCVFCTG